MLGRASTSGRWIRFPSCCCTTPGCAAQRPAIREKDLGIWQTWTWHSVRRRGARARLRPRRARASSAATTSRWSATTARASTPRCAPPSAWAASRCRSTRTRSPPRWRSSIQNAEIAYAVVEDQEQVDKLLEILPQCPTLKHIYLRRPARPAPLRRSRSSMSYEQAARARPRILPRATRRSSRPRSPRAGQPTPRRCSTPPARPAIPRAWCSPTQPDRPRPRRRARWKGLDDDDEVLAYLPMAWIGQNIFSYAQSLVAGFSHLLPGVGGNGDDRHARDRPDLLLRAAARARGAADPGDRSAWRMRARSSARCTTTSWTSRAGSAAAILDGKPVGAARPAAVRARRLARLRRRCATRSA